MYDVYQRRIAECDQELQKHLARFADTVPSQAKEEETKKKKGKQNKNNPQFHLADELQRITGVDLTRIDGIDVMVAQTLVSEVGLDMSRLRSQTYLGAQYRRLRSKLGAPKAITAMAHRLARLVYRMLKYGQKYVDKGAEYYEQRNHQQQIEFLRKKAAKLGLQVIAAHP